MQKGIYDKYHSAIKVLVMSSSHAQIVTPEPPEPDAKMVEFLSGLGLEKYVGILHEQEIDFEALINFSDDDLKRVGIKWVAVAFLGARSKHDGYSLILAPVTPLPW